jgi:pimeloyl-ACP methyl ester carboxylesterase
MSSDALPASPHVAPRTETVTSFDGTLIHYDVYDSASDATVIVVPGFWRDRRHASMVKLAHFLNAAGYRAVVIDVRGHGDSEGAYAFNLNEHNDVAAVTEDLLEKNPAISTVTLIGFSYGASIAISTVARHALPVASLLLISAVADFRMISPRINPFTIHRHIAFFSQALNRPRIAWSARKSDKLRAVDDIRDVHVPVCLIHVKNDWLIGHRHSVALYEAANEPKELHLLDIEGNYHADRIFNVASGSIEPIVRDFLARHLKNQKPETRNQKPETRKLETRN